jgi:hypothetical protein
MYVSARYKSPNMYIMYISVRQIAYRVAKRHDGVVRLPAPFYYYYYLYVQEKYIIIRVYVGELGERHVYT